MWLLITWLDLEIYYTSKCIQSSMYMQFLAMGGDVMKSFDFIL